MKGELATQTSNDSDFSSSDFFDDSDDDGSWNLVSYSYLVVGRSFLDFSLNNIPYFKFVGYIEYRSWIYTWRTAHL